MSAEPAASPSLPDSALTSPSSDAARPWRADELPVIFFDGVCGLCNAWIDFVMARDTRRIFRFGPLQGETARHWLSLPPEAAFDSVTLVDSTGVYRKSDAVWRILAQLGGQWRIIASLLRLVPRPISNWGYDFVARHRYRWFGKKETCRLPTAQERERFVL
jgi:predicted DCC family thiol-disulfide oxidoreductase YuxK